MERDPWIRRICYYDEHDPTIGISNAPDSVLLVSRIYPPQAERSDHTDPAVLLHRTDDVFDAQYE